jgi:hypothetical protein
MTSHGHFACLGSKFTLNRKGTPPNESQSVKEHIPDIVPVFFVSLAWIPQTDEHPVTHKTNGARDPNWSGRSNAA